MICGEVAHREKKYGLDVSFSDRKKIGQFYSYGAASPFRLYTVYPTFYGVSCVSEDILIKPPMGRTNKHRSKRIDLQNSSLCRIQPSKSRLPGRHFQTRLLCVPLKSQGKGGHRNALRETEAQGLPASSSFHFSCRCPQEGLAHHTPECAALFDYLGDGSQGLTGIGWPRSVITNGPLLTRTCDATFPIPHLNKDRWIREN